MTEQAITDAILRTALELQRVSAYEESRADEVLRQLTEELRQLLYSADLSAAGKREVEALIKEAESAIQARYGAIYGMFDAQGLTVHVAERTVEALQAGLAGSISLPTAETLASLSREVMIEGSPLKGWWAKQAEDTAFRFAAQVRQGRINNETQEQIVGRIVGRRGEPGVMDVSRRHARALVHTATMSAANEARMAVYRKNGKFIEGVKWLATLDSHTCKTCGALDGQAWNLEGEKLKGTTINLRFPPAHPSCFPGDTLVSTSAIIAGGSKRWFDGELVVIKTAYGRELSCTPNHPILTDRGWVAAALLNVGSNVVCYSGGKGECSVDGDSKDIPSTIHDVTESFLTSSKVASSPMKVSPEHFHGDGGGSNVAIVWTDSLLSGAVDAAFDEPSMEVALIDGTGAGLVNLPSESHFAPHIEASRAPSHCGMCGGDLGAPLLLRHATPLHGFGLGLATPHDLVLTQDAGNDISGNSELSGDSVFGKPTSVEVANASLVDCYTGPDRHLARVQLAQDYGTRDPGLPADFNDIDASKVEFDTVIEASLVSFSGHVYNLETSTGWYIAQGIVVHNCRCVMSPVPKSLDSIFGRDDLDDFAASLSRRASSQGPVAGTTTFADFLKRQSPEFVEQTLGKKRAELYLAGKLTLRDLVSGTGRPLTLDELRTR